MKMTGKHDGMALAERVRKALGNNVDVTEKRMTGTAKPGFMFRVGKGKPGFVWVDPDACDTRALKRWLKLAERYVATPPPKRT